MTRQQGWSVFSPRSLLLSFELLHIEIELLALENVAVESAGLSGAGGDASQDRSGVELVGHLLVDLAVLATASELGFEMAGALGVFTSFIRFFKLLLVEFDVVLLEVPVSEGGRIDVHDGVLHKGLGTHELVVRRVVNDIEHASLEGHSLGTPGEVSVVKSEASVLQVSAASAHKDDALGSNTGHGGHTSHLELSLLLVNWHAATSGPSLLARVPRNTHTS